jgi:hypothetical protein
MSHGLALDFNYTFSKSIDIGSNAERVNEFEGFGLGSQIINAWQPNALRAVSDFDTKHQISTNWVYQLLLGHGKAFELSGIADKFLGGWDISGLARWTSGFPCGVDRASGSGPLIYFLSIPDRPCAHGTFIDSSGTPNVFSKLSHSRK